MSFSYHMGQKTFIGASCINDIRHFCGYYFKDFWGVSFQTE